jgi:histidine triad (HIT) family protein
VASIFTRILNKEIPGEILFEDDKCFALRDINPQAPVHLLLIPKKEIAAISDLKAEDAALVGHLLVKAGEIAKAQGIAADGYRLVINTGAGAGQTVFHIHVHILGGRPFGWPPG